MYLKFSIEKSKLEALYKSLAIASQIWGNDGVFLKFDNKSVRFYVLGDIGFNKVGCYIDITIELDGEAFFKEYVLKSEKDGNTIILAPVSFKNFLNVLKVLSTLEGVKSFKLKKHTQDNISRKYLLCECVIDSGNVEFFIDIETYFQQQYYPMNFNEKDVMFTVGEAFNREFMQRFINRVEVKKEPIASVTFKRDADDKYLIKMASETMKATTNFSFQIRELVPNSSQKKYKLRFNTDNFLVLFSLLKIPGMTHLKIINGEKIEAEHVVSKAKNIRIMFETTSFDK